MNQFFLHYRKIKDRKSKVIITLNFNIFRYGEVLREGDESL